MTTPAHAYPVCESTPIGSDTSPDNFCDGDGGGSGGTGGATPPTYVLQGVIENQGYQYDGAGIGRRVHIRGYSRLANANNDRVDADFIQVTCYAYDRTGATHETDSESNGALVDVHFDSNWVYGVYRTITVNCTHHATKYGVVYDTTSTAQINIPG